MAQMQLVFNGTTPTTTLWNGQNVPAGSGSPFFDLNQGLIVPYNSNDQIITWNTYPGQLPGFLQGQTINTLTQSPLNINFYDIQYTATCSITSGYQYAEDLSEPVLEVQFIDETTNPGNIAIFNYFTMHTITFATSGPILDQNYYYCSSTDCPSITQSVSPNILNAVQVISWNMCRLAGCINQTLFDLTFQISINVTLTINCSAAAFTLDSGFCPNFCTANNTNLALCKGLYTNYCFTGVTGANPPGSDIILVGNTGCMDFFIDYYTNIGPDAATDTLISNYCTAKFAAGGFQGLFYGNTGPNHNFDVDLCACHMPPQLYTDYANSVDQQFPNFITFIDNSGIDQRCLVQFCATSDFPTTDISHPPNSFKCQIPACIQVAEFNADGTFNNNNVSISQQGNCEQIKSGQTTGPTGASGAAPSTKSWWEKYWIWVLLGVGLLIVLIIVILIIVASQKHKKKGTESILRKSSDLTGEVGIEGEGEFPGPQDV